MKNNHSGNSLFVSILLWGMSFVWVVFSLLFSIFSYIENIYFALDKVSGHFFSLPILLTLFFFIFLLVAYGIVTYFLIRNKYVNNVILLTLGITLAISVTAALFTYPVGALDLFNYVLMGKLLVFYQQNPFLISFESIGSQDALSKYAIFLNVTTGYGPWWLLLTGAAVLLSGSTAILSMVISYKVMTAFFFLLTGVLLYLLPEDKQDKLLAAGIYLLNPYIIFEGIVNAHNDILVSFFVILACWMYKKKNVALFLCIILAGLIKLYALALLPVFLLMVVKDKWRRKEILLSLVMGFIGLLFAYVPFWGKGKLIHGVLQGLQNAQTINGFSPYSLIREYATTGQTLLTSLSLIQYSFMGIFLCIFVGTLFYVVKTKDYLHGCICILVTFFLCITIYQPWYVIPVLGLLALSQKKSDYIFTFIISSGALVSYPVSVWAWFHSGWNTWAIHLFLACFIALPSVVYLVFFFKNIIMIHNTVQD